MRDSLPPQKPLHEIIDEMKLQKKLQEKAADISAEKKDPARGRGWADEATENRLRIYFER